MKVLGESTKVNNCKKRNVYNDNGHAVVLPRGSGGDGVV